MIEIFFQTGDDITLFDVHDGAIYHKRRVELTVQQTVTVMLRLKSQWKLAVEELARRDQNKNHRSREEDTTNHSGDKPLEVEDSDINDNDDDSLVTKEEVELENIVNILVQKVI